LTDSGVAATRFSFAAISLGIPTLSGTAPHDSKD